MLLLLALLEKCLIERDRHRDRQTERERKREREREIDSTQKANASIRERI